MEAPGHTIGLPLEGFELAAEMDTHNGISDLGDDEFSDSSDGSDESIDGILFTNAIFEYYKRQKLCTLKRRIGSSIFGDRLVPKVLPCHQCLPKVSGNASVLIDLKAHLDNLYGSVLPEELKVGVCAIYDAYCSEEAIRFQQCSEDLISQIFSFCNELSRKVRDAEKFSKDKVEAADASEVPSKAEVNVACSVPNKSQIAETNLPHSFDGGHVSLHLGYHSVSSETNEEGTKVCSNHVNISAQQIHSDKVINSNSGCSPMMKLSKPVVDLSTPEFFNEFNGSLNASGHDEGSLCPNEAKADNSRLLDMLANISSPGASKIHGSKLCRSIDYVPDIYSPMSREKYFSMLDKKVPRCPSFGTVAKSTCDGDMTKGPTDVIHISDGDNDAEAKSNLKNNDEVQFVCEESFQDRSRALRKESEKLYNAALAEGTEKRAYLGVLKLGMNKDLKRYCFAALMKETNNFSYVQKSFDGASLALQLSKADMDHHWFIFIVDLKNKNFTFLDSLYSENDEYHIKVREILLPNFMKVWCDFVITPIDVDNFPYVYPVVPKQDNKTDCGVFVLKFLQFWTPEGRLCSSFSQADIVNIRIQLVTDLLFSEHNTKDIYPVRQYFGEDGCPRAGRVRNGSISRKFK
ncbi:hypothetical protein ACP4OV_025020 [Aristida adscensionis]